MKLRELALLLLIRDVLLILAALLGWIILERLPPDWEIAWWLLASVLCIWSLRQMLWFGNEVWTCVNEWIDSRAKKTQAEEKRDVAV